MNNENTENSVDVDHQSLINILLQNPEDFNLKQKPSGIRENRMFTLDKREIPMSSAKTDDNGAYISKGSVTKFYMYNEEGSRPSHKDGNGVWYVLWFSSVLYVVCYHIWFAHAHAWGFIKQSFTYRTAMLFGVCSS